MMTTTYQWCGWGNRGEPRARGDGRRRYRGSRPAGTARWRAARCWVGLLVWVGCCASVPGLRAQVSVDVEFERDRYLADEAVVAVVHVTNFSGRTLHLGKAADWLTFSVESEDRFIVKQYGQPPVVEEFVLPSASRATRRVDLAPYFGLSQSGRYRVFAIVKLPDTHEELASAPKVITVVQGIKLWEQEVGLPGRPDTPPSQQELRKFALVQAIGQDAIRLYVRVTDQYEAKVYRVLLLGPVVSFGHPEAQVDRLGALHVLFQSGARTFHYEVILPDGRLALRETHAYSDTRPVLRPDKDGMVKVAGGVRVRRRDDWPPAAAQTAAVTPPPGGATNTAPTNLTNQPPAGRTP